ncbi:MAG: aspartate/glutamate leucyltransferase, partial [Shimia sp.]
PTRGQRKIMNRNAHLKRAVSAPWATEEQFDLFRRYLDKRHADGGMADMDIFEFAAMIEETPVRSRVVEYMAPHDDGADLTAVCLTDVLDDGVSLVYSFYEPDLARASLGTYIILDHIRIAREAGLPYVYLGYWVPGSPKMSYKAKFKGVEVHHRGEWRPLKRPESYSSALDPMAVAPISEQVAQINLPDILAGR